MGVYKMRSSVITKKNKTEHNVIREHTFRPPLERPRNTMPLPPALPVIIIKHDNKSPSARFCCHFPNLSGRWARERGRRGGGTARRERQFTPFLLKLIYFRLMAPRSLRKLNTVYCATPTAL